MSDLIDLDDSDIPNCCFCIYECAGMIAEFLSFVAHIIL